jgi:DNA-binding NarL/FixJ family response regulator
MSGPFPVDWRGRVPRGHNGVDNEMETVPRAISCLIADDHPAMVEAVAGVLKEQGIEIAGRARDGAEALAKLESLQPDVAVVDLRMPRLSGIELARRASTLQPAPAIVLYTAYGDRALLMEALDAGARGFVLKEAPLADLVRAVELVADGGTYVDPVLAGVFATSAATQKLPSLSQREREVLRLLSEGRSNEEIGKELFISPETVRTHLRKAMTKLDADTRTQAVATALRQSLIA